MRDRTLLYAAAFLRSLATGMAGVLLGIHLAKCGLDAASIGAVVSAGLGGTALAALAVTVAGNRFGRRRTLVLLAVLGAAGGVALAVASRFGVIATGAFVGMVNGMGRDRGPSLVLDQTILPGTLTDSDRTRAFAWYNVLQDAGHALGGLAAGAPTLVRRLADVEEFGSLRIAFVAYAVLLLASGALYLGLSAAIEVPDRARTPRVTVESQRILWRISSLFALDGLAGGFLTTALLAFFFFERFGVSEAGIGGLFFCARLANAGSHLAAAWLAQRIGLVNTMVFTHLPSSLLLASVPIAPTFAVASVLFLLREGLVEMDVPTRQSYVMAVVRPEERMIASGVTHLVRLGSWAVAPALAGLLMTQASLAAPLLVGSGMKIAYDVLLYVALRRTKPPEEAVRD